MAQYLLQERGTMRAWSRLRIWLATALIALGAATACNTPSVPLPPPLLNALTAAAGGMPGMVVIEGAPTSRHANVRFYIFNRSRNDGVITQAAADGSFTTSPFAGSDGDLIQLYFDMPDGTRSQDACAALHLNGPLQSTNCQ